VREDEFTEGVVEGEAVDTVSGAGGEDEICTCGVHAWG